MANHKKLVKVFATAHFVILHWVILSTTRDPINLASLISMSSLILFGAVPIICLSFYILTSQGKAFGGQFLLYLSILLSALFAIETLYSPTDLAAFSFVFALILPWLVTIIGLVAYWLYIVLQSFLKKPDSPSIED